MLFAVMLTIDYKMLSEGSDLRRKAPAERQNRAAFHSFALVPCYYGKQHGNFLDNSISLN